MQTVFQTLDDVATCLERAKRIVVLTGAGISVSCGIPDFRSEGGIYRLVEQYGFDLEEPESLFDIEFFDRDPVPFFTFAKTLFPGEVQPSPMHHFIAALDRRKKLLRNYTQNIDCLEQVAGVKRCIACHGSFATASCRGPRCRYRCGAAEIRDRVMRGEVPRCPSDGCGGVLKPDITFFGQPLPKVAARCLQRDREAVDCLLVVGTSLAVAPMSTIVGFLPPEVPQILINKRPIKPPRHLSKGFDAQLIGDADEIALYLASRLGLDRLGAVAIERDAPAAAAPPPPVEAAPPAEAPAAAPSTPKSRRGRKRRAPRRFEETPTPPKRAAAPRDGKGAAAAAATAAQGDGGPAVDAVAPGVFVFPSGAEHVGEVEAALRRDGVAFQDRCFFEIVTCDACGERLEGSYFTCRQCFGYDLCRGCFRNGHNEHSRAQQHRFRRIEGRPPDA